MGGGRAGTNQSTQLVITVMLLIWTRRHLRVRTDLNTQTVGLCNHVELLKVKYRTSKAKCRTVSKT